jgi:8-oxo-dGTP diphosphatase
MNEVIPTVGVIVFDENHVLLVRKKNHPQQLLQLPGGQIEHEESIEQAAVRELYENTGLKADVNGLVVLPDEWRATIQKDYGTKNFSFKAVICRQYTGEAKEAKDALPVWVERSELEELQLVPNVLAAVKKAEQHN